MTTVLATTNAADTLEAIEAHVLLAGDLSFELSTSGDVHAIRAGELLIGQFLPGPHDGSPSGVYLRRHRPEGIDVQQIVGSASAVTLVEAGERRVAWSGSCLGVDHRVELTVDASNMWVWRVTLSAAEAGVEYDVVMAQDLALSPVGAALSSEPYVCQYIVHRVLDHASGPALASRQTMTAAPYLPLVVSAIAEGASGYLTDAMQTHTPMTRLDGEAHGLAGEVNSEIYQYELSMPTLVSHRLRPADGPVSVHAYAVFFGDAPGDLAENAQDLDAWATRATEIAAQPIAMEDRRATISAFRGARLLSGRDVSDAELLEIAGVEPDSVLLPERGEDGRLLSFFTSDATHVVRGEKDLVVERSHGHVLKAGDDIAPRDEILSTTAYAQGVFASHVVLGNTTANRLVTVQRHHLNLMRTSGIRVLIGDPESELVPGSGTGSAPEPAGSELRLLGAPSAVTFDIGGVHWVYLTELGRVDVRTVAAAHANRIDVIVESEARLRIIATVDIECGDELQLWSAEHVDAATVRLVPAPDSDAAVRYPNLTYLLSSSAPLNDDSGLFYREGGAVDEGDPLASSAHQMLTTQASGHGLSLAITASLTGACTQDALKGDLDVADELAGHLETMRSLALGLRIGGDSVIPSDELDLLVPWYVHDASIHFLVPHGLEQYSGAAWGTRDAAQGPFELHLAFGRFDIARQVVLTMFAHQNPAGDFPQWFMFDAYVDRYGDDAHGDVVVWPLFALGQYLRATGDVAILRHEIPFWNDVDRCPGELPVSLASHVETLLDYVDNHRLPGTALPAYGHGDWDDTLQPADPTMRTSMASGWTAALLAQAARMTAAAIDAAGNGESAHDEPSDGEVAHGELVRRLEVLGEAVEADLREHLLVDGVMAGYVSLADGRSELIIHPLDARTGITYRLIPMTRSIIAGILEPQEALAHEQIIRERLHFPDGVRLMDRPAAFDDGVPHVFLRAEQAAAVGREIGLMYTHAHIRWVEALSALGRADALAELIRISPLGINERLPHAEPRQRNVYYSSSDAAFPDRYSFAEGFDLLRTGEVGVKGGWRVYSSGPGIFLRQLFQGVLGLRILRDSVVFDPVLPADADGLRLDVELAGEMRSVRYAVRPGADRVEVRGGSSDGELRSLAGSTVSGRYRDAGLEVSFTELRDCSVVEVILPAGS